MRTSSSGRKPRRRASSLPITSTSVAATGGQAGGGAAASRRAAAAKGALDGARAPPIGRPPCALGSTAPATAPAAVVVVAGVTGVVSPAHGPHSAAALASGSGGGCGRSALCAWHLQRRIARVGLVLVLGLGLG